MPLGDTWVRWGAVRGIRLKVWPEDIRLQGESEGECHGAGLLQSCVLSGDACSARGPEKQRSGRPQRQPLDLTLLRASPLLPVSYFEICLIIELGEKKKGF